MALTQLTFPTSLPTHTPTSHGLDSTYISYQLIPNSYPSSYLSYQLMPLILPFLQAFFKISVHQFEARSSSFSILCFDSTDNRFDVKDGLLVRPLGPNGPYRFPTTRDLDSFITNIRLLFFSKLV